MFCKLLTIVLIVASTSARHVGKRRQEVNFSCDQYPHPLETCSGDWSVYPTTLGLRTFSGFEDIKTQLKARNAFENICSEGRQFISCFTGELEKARPKCQAEYANQQWTPEYFNKASTWLNLACTAENIRIFRDNVDCVVNPQVVGELELCAFSENPNIHCSESDSECFRRRSQRNCDADDVVYCQKEVLSTACGSQAGNLLGSLGGAFFERFPICPDHGIQTIHSVEYEEF